MPTSSPLRTSRYRSALFSLTVAGCIFRSEIAALVTSHAFYLLLAPHVRVPPYQIIAAGLAGLIFSLFASVPIDTFFWNKSTPLWPELTGFIYNVVEGKSRGWGTQPWHFYFSAALPRLLFNPVIYQVCIPLAVATPVIREPVLDILIPNLLFVALYSFLPHKEWRFVVYVVPPLLAVTSAGASWIWIRQNKKIYFRFLSLAIMASMLASFAASGAILYVSQLNYPGAEALNRLHILERNGTGIVRVHLDTFTCMTGVTRFLERPPPPLLQNTAGQIQSKIWVYDKTEDEEKLLSPVFWETVDYAITERPERVPGPWEVLDIVDAYAGIGLERIAVKGSARSSRGWQSSVVADHDTSELQISAKIVNFFLAIREYLTSRVTRGWWLVVRLEPKLRILKKERFPRQATLTYQGITEETIREE